jgi:Ser/Thr protein kinase RdoA (MazF antagonist)
MKTGWSLSRLVGLSSTAEDDVQTTLAAAYHEITQMEDALERLLADLRAARRVRSESQVEAAIAKIVPPAPGGGTGSEHAS